MEEVRLSIGFCGEKIQSIKAFVLEDLGKAYFDNASCCKGSVVVFNSFERDFIYVP
ncbi:hypothetical protein LguiA_025411 [Lonicera macranthoides]